MASINATTSSGIVATADNTGQLQLQSAGTTAINIDTSQRVAFVAGTAALPAITTTGDTNTGMFFPAADTIAFAEGGVEVMRLDSSGNVLVGTSSVVPTETGVVIQQNNSTNHATVTYKYTASPSSSATVTFNTTSLGFSGSIQYCVEVTASAYGNSSTGVGTYKGMVTGFSGLSGSYQAVTNIVSAMTSTGSFTLAGGTNQVILTITNTNGSQAKFGVVRFDVTWGG